MKTVRIYGFVRDRGSYGQVTSGFMEALVDYGYVAGHGAGALDLVGLDEDQTFEEEPTGLPLADIALFTGPPSMCPRMTQGTDHKLRLVMVAPNSSKLPDRMMSAVNAHATHVMTPSAWGKTVVERYTTLPVIVVPHGVSKRFVPQGGDRRALFSTTERYWNKEFRVLHLSSSDGERKGTLELCRAFEQATKKGLIPARSELRLILTPSGKGRLLDEGVLTRSMTIANRVISGLEPEAMVREYEAAHVVCQPSRGEGFGMVPLEALSVGTPVVATAATGHAEWFHDLHGAVEVTTGPDGPIDDMPGAVAPTVAADDIAEALGLAFDGWPVLKKGASDQAPAVSFDRSWANALRPLRLLLEA